MKFETFGKFQATSRRTNKWILFHILLNTYEKSRCKLMLGAKKERLKCFEIHIT
jgi:hypothetical protein